jgi:glutathione S-transferase
MRDDGSVITEYGAIATWLAKTNPAAKLLPDDLESEIRIIETMDYCVGSVHMQGYTRLFRPVNFTPNEADHKAVKARGREIVTKAYAHLDKAMSGKDYVVGSYSIADSALFYVEFWSGIMKIDLPPNLAAHLKRMMARPAVQRVLKAEGLDQAKA